jgi:hypothetical protein
MFFRDIEQNDTPVMRIVGHLHVASDPFPGKWSATRKLPSWNPVHDQYHPFLWSRTVPARAWKSAASLKIVWSRIDIDY